MVQFPPNGAFVVHLISLQIKNHYKLNESIQSEQDGQSSAGRIANIKNRKLLNILQDGLLINPNFITVGG